MKFRKYEFSQSEWDAQKSKIEKTDGEGNKYFDESIVASVVELGVLDEQVGKLAVDIIWQDNEITSFAKYKVWPAPVGNHSFGYDIDSEYAAEYYKLFPQPSDI